MTAEKTKLRDGDSLRCPYCHDNDFESVPSLRCHACRAWQHTECGEGKCGACGAKIGKTQDDLIRDDAAALRQSGTGNVQIIGDGNVAIIGAKGPINVDMREQRVKPKRWYCITCGDDLKPHQGLYCDRHRPVVPAPDTCTDCGSTDVFTIDDQEVVCEACVAKRDARRKRSDQEVFWVLVGLVVILLVVVLLYVARSG